MKLYVKNKVFTFGGSSFVLNETGEKVYTVKGKWFSPTRKKILKDTDGNVLYKIRNQWFNFIFNKALIYDSENEKVAKVTNDGILGFKLVGYPDNVVIKRGIRLKREIYKNGDCIGAVTRKFDFFRDSFELEINDNEDVPFFVALVIDIDNIRDKDRDDTK